MRSALASLLLIAVGLLHVVPVAGVLGADKLSKLYGVDVSDPSLALLMRHRAVLLAIVGGLLLASVPWAHLRVAAVITGFASVLSFLVLALSEQPLNPQIRMVVAADLAALGALTIAAALHYKASS